MSGKIMSVVSFWVEGTPTRPPPVGEDLIGSGWEVRERRNEGTINSLVPISVAASRLQPTSIITNINVAFLFLIPKHLTSQLL